MPLFISQRRLALRKTLPKALGRWALDSGGFTELEKFGRWETTPEQYVAAVRRYQVEIGGLDWAAIQDWMCEPWIVEKTGLSVERHQQLTIESYQRLYALAPEIPWCPVIQGWEMQDYHRHVAAYLRAGIDLFRFPVVGIGSVCRRQHVDSVARLIKWFARTGLRLHGFGFKVKGLQACHESLASADSMAWSRQARYQPPLFGHSHKTCANCLEFALFWRKRLLAGLSPVPSQVRRLA